MAEHRAVRMGIDVGGTYTKCVAMDNLTHEIIGKNEVKTTHDDKDGVAAGVVQSFKNCMAENNIALRTSSSLRTPPPRQPTPSSRATLLPSVSSVLQAAAWKASWQSAS